MRIATRMAGILAAAGFVALPAAAHIERYWAPLDGPSEAPPNASPGIGWAYVIVDLDLATMQVRVVFSGLTGNVSASHIHGVTTNPFSGTAGVMTPTPSFPGFPSGVTAGEYNRMFDLTVSSSYNAAFITAQGGLSNAMNTMLNGFETGRTYLNIHTSTFGGGEIRGFLRPVCPADFSGSSDPNSDQYGFPDGIADSSDFFYYLDQFTLGNVGVGDLSGSADPNDPLYGQPDGMIDAADFFYYLDLFVAGCP